MARKPACVNCKHFWRYFFKEVTYPENTKLKPFRQSEWPSGPDTLYHPTPAGECRLKSPVVGERKWPVVNIYDGCGDHDFGEHSTELDTKIRKEIISEVGLNPVDP